MDRWTWTIIALEQPAPSVLASDDITSLPTSRETLRAETISTDQASQVFPREPMKLRSVSHCRSAMSPQEFRLQREKYGGLGHAVDRSIHGMEKRYSCPPCSIATIGMSSNFGAVLGKFHRYGTWLQVLTTLTN